MASEYTASLQGVYDTAIYFLKMQVSVSVQEPGEVQFR